MNPGDTLHLGKRAANKGGCSAWWNCDRTKLTMHATVNIIKLQLCLSKDTNLTRSLQLTSCQLICHDVRQVMSIPISQQLQCNSTPALQQTSCWCHSRPLTVAAHWKKTARQLTLTYLTCMWCLHREWPRLSFDEIFGITKLESPGYRVAVFAGSYI